MTDDVYKSIDLEDTFLLHGQSSREHLVKLSPTAISITPASGTASASQTQIIDIDDLSKRPASAATPEKKPHRSHQTLTYVKFNDYERNLAEVSRWHRLVTSAIYLRRNLPADIVMNKREKRALVFINPASGAGKAHRLVMENVVGVWSEAEFSHHMILTEYAGHARDYVRSINLDEWSGIILASGDGLVFEVINGLMSRPDWQEALKLPIGHLPGGSGNAFITNIVRYSKQPVMDTMKEFIVQAAILIATHQVIPFDLAVIHTRDDQRLFSFLCVEWGIIADVDCESEKYRFLGETRFTVEAVKRILFPRVYNGYIDYLPYDAADSTAENPSIPPNTPSAQLQHHLLPLSETIPTDSSNTKWRRINGPFAHVLITSKASISKDIVASSESTLADGFLTLQLIRSNASARAHLAKTFTKLSTGSHFEFDFVEWMRIRAFRIVPEENSGNMMVDGEKVPYGPIQGEILPGIGRCMGKQPRTHHVATAEI